MSSWAGKCVRIDGPCSVTTISSSIRAADTPSLAGQYVSSANTMPACSSIGSRRLLSRLMTGRSCNPSEAVAKLQTKGVHLAGETKVSRRGPRERNLVRADTGLDELDRQIHPRSSLGVGLALWRRRTPDRHRAVVARAIAVVGVNDVKECLVPGANDSIGEVVGMGIAPFARDRVDGLHLIRTHLVESLVRERDDLILAYSRLQCFKDVLVDAVDHGGGL